MNRQSVRPGFVYALSNPGMVAGLLKIGQTTRSARERALELSDHSGVPAPFEVEIEVAVPDVDRAERYLHRELKSARFHKGREFFQVELDVVKDAAARMTALFAAEAEADWLTDEK